MEILIILFLVIMAITIFYTIRSRRDVSDKDTAGWKAPIDLKAETGTHKLFRHLEEKESENLDKDKKPNDSVTIQRK